MAASRGLAQTARASTPLLPVAPLLGRDPRAKDPNSGDDQQRGQPPGKKDRGQPDDEDREARDVQDDSRPHARQRNAQRPALPARAPPRRRRPAARAERLGSRF